MAASERDVRLFLESRRMARQLGRSSPDLFPTRAAQNEAAANRAASLKESYESLPAPVRVGVSAVRSALDAAALGYRDEISSSVMRAVGRPTAATVDEMMEHADRGIGEKVAGGVGYLAGTIPVAMATGLATTAGMAAAAPRLAGRAPALARTLNYLTQAAPAPASAGRVAAREALRGGATRGAAAGGLENMGRVRSAVEIMRGGGGAAGQGARQALAQGAAQNVAQGLGFSALTEPVRDLPEGTSRAESVALNTGVGAVADALLYPVFGRFAPAARTPLRDGRRAINAIPFRHTTTPRSSDVPATLFVPEPAPRGIETQGAPTQVEAALRRANELSTDARLAEDEAALQASLAQRQRMGEAPSAPRVLGPRGQPARATPDTPTIEIAPAPIRGRPIEPQRGRIAPDEPSPRFTGATAEPGTAADVALRRARALAEPVPEPDVDVPLRSAAEIGQRRAVELTQPDRAAREAPARSLLIPEPEPREVSLLDAQGRPLRRPVEPVVEPETPRAEPEATPEPAAQEPDVLDLSAARQRRARTETAVGNAPLTLRDEAVEELASLPPKVRTIVENALGADTEQALVTEMSNLQGVRMTDQQAQIVNGLFARARERLAPKTDAAPVAAATETDLPRVGTVTEASDVVTPAPASTLEAGGRRASGRATEIDSETLLGDMRALNRALPTAEADPNVRVIEVSGDATALREAVQQAGAPERIFRIGDNEYVVLAPAEQADAVLAAARERGLAGGAGNTLDEANTAMRSPVRAAPRTTDFPTGDDAALHARAVKLLDDAVTASKNAAARQFNGAELERVRGMDPASLTDEQRAALRQIAGDNTPEQERVVRPAIRVNGGEPIEGATHPDAIRAAGIDAEAGSDRYTDMLARGEVEEGFVTSTGRFVTRDEARKTAFGAGQAQFSNRGLIAEELPPMGDRTPDAEPRAPEAQAVEPEAPREPGGWQQAERDRIAAGTKRVGDTASERAPAEAPAEPAISTVDDFTASMAPASRARAESALATSMNHNGTVRTRREIVETMVGDGAKVVAHPKDGRRLMRPDGSFIEERRLTKVAMDYAEHLSASRDAPDAPAPRAAEPLPETRRPDAAVESRPRAASIDGQETSVRNLAGKGEARVRYRAVESSNLQASHNASTLQKNPAYPEGVQPRQYERDKNLQESVARLQQEFDPRVVTSNTALATEGPPISTPDGITLSGNSRLMAMQRIYAQGGEQAAQLRQAMIDAGEQFGIPRAELEQMRQPIIDRELIDEGLDLTQRDVLRSVADRANVATTKADDPIADASNRARRLVQPNATTALRHLEQTIGAEQTIRDYLGTANGRRFVDQLVEAEVLSPDELSRYVDSAGYLTTPGRDLVEQTLLAAAVDDADVLARASREMTATVKGLTHAAPAILRARTHEGWNVQGAINEGLDVVLRAKSQNMTVRDLLDQHSMFSEARPSSHGATMAAFLESSPTQAEIKDAFRRYAREAAMDGDLFAVDARPPAQAFDEIFGAPERMAKSKRKPCR